VSITDEIIGVSQTIGGTYPGCPKYAQTSTIAVHLSWTVTPMSPWDIGRPCNLDALAQPSFWASSRSQASA